MTSEKILPIDQDNEHMIRVTKQYSNSKDGFTTQSHRPRTGQFSSLTHVSYRFSIIILKPHNHALRQ